MSLKVYVYPADFWACGHYRLVWPAYVIQAAAHDIEVDVIAPGSDHSGLGAHCRRDGTVFDAFAPEDADLIVLQRPSYPALAAAIPFIRAKGVAVVVDIDDDLSHIDPRNPAWMALHPKKSTEFKQEYPHSWQCVADSCRAATVLTTSTQPLADRYGPRGPGRSFAVPNYVPRDFLTIDREDSADIGWAGSTHSHPGDLKVVGAAVSQVCREHDTTFTVVGNGEGAGRDLGMDVVDSTGPIEFKDWALAVSKIGIGIAPLQASRFNTAKSWLKPLEYSALGVPWVASPREEYVRMHDLGCGAIADKPKEWRRELARLASSADYRQEASGRAREVASTLTIEARAGETLYAWLEAIRLQRAETPRPVRHARSSGVVGIQVRDATRPGMMIDA